MRRILITSHGKFAEGLKHMASMVLGDIQADVLTFQDGMGIDEFRNHCDEIFSQYSLKDDEIIILSDLKNGTPYNVCAQYILNNKLENNTKLFYGMNFPMLLVAVEYQEGEGELSGVYQKVMDIQKEQVGIMNITTDSEDEEF